MEGMIQWVTKNFQQFGPSHFGKLKHHNYYYVPYDNNNNNNNNNGNLQKISSRNSRPYGHGPRRRGGKDGHRDWYRSGNHILLCWCLQKRPRRNHG
mmetsp:Transcript_33704/g.70867  ORF Transcript_33704/g.70867 Transcript_33704/m.70867 type:complete len:96 (-) Transcript_33704:1038-1325(-)